jgi:hypothetical protein
MTAGTNEERPAPPPTATPPGRHWRVLAILLLCLVGSGVVSFVAFSYILVPSVPRELIGTWRVVEGAYKGATFECSWNGNAIFSVQKKGKTESDKSTIKVRGKRIFLTGKDPITGQEDTLILVILKLTEDELVFRDQDQTVYNMIRIGD